MHSAARAPRPAGPAGARASGANAARLIRAGGSGDCRRRRRQEAPEVVVGGAAGGVFAPPALRRRGALVTRARPEGGGDADAAPARQRDDEAGRPPAYLSARESQQQQQQQQRGGGGGAGAAGGPPSWQAAWAPAQAPQQQTDPPPLVRVRFHVHYRVHSRQMLCIGGSQIPFGWSFLSIAKVPMTWNAGDVWTCEVDLPAGGRGRPPLEYKYVVLEEQDWTALRDDASEGLVPLTYRSAPADGSQPSSRPPPDAQSIARKMAIVAWQPGPNRALAVPSEAEIAALAPGIAVERAPARPTSGGAGTGPGGLGEGGGAAGAGAGSGGGGAGWGGQVPLPEAAAAASDFGGSSGRLESQEQRQQQQQAAGGGQQPPLLPLRDPYEGTWEVLSLEPTTTPDEQQVQLSPLLSRHDVWGYHPAQPAPPPAAAAASENDDGGGGGGGGGGGPSSSQRPAGLPRFGI